MHKEKSRHQSYIFKHQPENQSTCAREKYIYQIGSQKKKGAQKRRERSNVINQFFCEVIERRKETKRIKL